MTVRLSGKNDNKARNLAAPNCTLVSALLTMLITSAMRAMFTGSPAQNPAKNTPAGSDVFADVPYKRKNGRTQT